MVQFRLRLAVYGGAVQAALTSAKSSSEVIASRMGIGAQAADLTTAENGVGGGLWVAPIYKNVDSDGFEAQALRLKASTTAPISTSTVFP